MKNKIIASYSGGKDSILALYLAMKNGYQPIRLITTYNSDRARSWFHGLTDPVLDAVSESLQIPIQKIVTTGDMYAENFVNTLLQLKESGAELCVFGDIDIDEHLQWCRDRCDDAGISALFPLWKRDRKEIVRELINAGFTARITIVNTKLLSAKFLGEILTYELLDEIERDGADVCGENGEYHTFVSDGPIFNNPINVKYGSKITENGYAILPIVSATTTATTRYN
jgi:uncharacterized protein (TIGR00290 family)